MIFADRQFIMKDGRTCTLTPSTADYAQQLIDYMKITAGETDFLLRYPDEINYTLEGEIAFLNNAYDDEKSIMMAAVVDGQIAGNGSINGIAPFRRVNHRASLAIALKQEYWGMGIGRQLMEYMLELAAQIGYEQAELAVIDGNDRARALYEKCGFVETGRNINAIKYDDGTYCDEIIMYKKLG